MSTMLTEQPGREIVRPLSVLIPLIKRNIEEIDRAGVPFQKAVGEMLAEAKENHFPGHTEKFWSWAEKNFKKSRVTLRTYMAYGIRAIPHKPFKNLHGFIHAPKDQGGLGHTPRMKASRRAYTPEVDAISERARREQVSFVLKDNLTQAQERQAERELAHRLIDIGFKVLAKELHPDKVGGDRTAMARLNRVRTKLKHSI